MWIYNQSLITTRLFHTCLFLKIRIGNFTGSITNMLGISFINWRVPIQVHTSSSSRSSILQSSKTLPEKVFFKNSLC